MRLAYQDIRRYKYRVKENTQINLSNWFSKDIMFEHPFFQLIDGVLSIRKGYCWDGATCAIDTPCFALGSLVHDVLYQAIRLGYLDKKDRLKADNILKWVIAQQVRMVVDGKETEHVMPRWRQSYVYRAVRTAGGVFMSMGKADNPVIEVYL